LPCQADPAHRYAPAQRHGTRLVEKAEGIRAKIFVLSISFGPGERLDALGGIAALLRYKMWR